MKLTARARRTMVQAHTLKLMSSAALLIAISGPAWAESGAQPDPTTPSQPASSSGPSTQAGAPVQLEEVVVTAQKRKENLQTVPIAVQAFSAQKLAAANVSGLTDLVSLTPSLRFSFSSQSGSLFLRGVGNATTFPGSESEVQLYIDNVYYGSSAGNFMKFDSIDRIEVDKGPQGTLFGRNATGGVIQIFTRDPTQTPRLDVSAGYGNFNGKQVDLYASRGLTDQLAADIAIHFEDHDGWGYDAAKGKGAFSADDLGIRSKWIYQPSSSTKLTLIGNYGRDESNQGSALVVANGGWRPSLTAPVTAFDGYYNPQGNFGGNATVKYYGGSLKVDQKIGDLSLVSITAGEITKSLGQIDADSTPAPVLAGFDYRDEAQASEELQLLSPQQGRLRWIVGSYLYYNDAKSDPATLSGLTFSGPPFFATDIENYSTMKTYSASVFGQATYDLTHSTHITAGVRYTYDHRSQTGLVQFVYPTGPGPAPPFLGLGVNNYPHVSFKAVTGKIVVSQDFTKNILGYVGYSRGYKAGTFNNLIVIENPQPALQPEYIDAYEGGLKTDLLDRRLRLNFSAFYYKYSNLQVTIFQNINTALENAASATIKGLEAEGEFALTSSTRLTTGASLLDAKYESFPNAPLYTLLSPTTFNASNHGFGGLLISDLPNGADGNTLPQAPKFSGYVGINQLIETDVGSFNLNSMLTYQSRIYFTPDNLFSQRGYANLTASAKWTDPSRRYDVTLWARNLTGVHTWSSETVSAYVNAGVPNEPRVYGFKVGMHF